MASDDLHDGTVTEPPQGSRSARAHSARKVAAALATLLAIALIVFVTNVGGLRSRVTGGRIERIGSIAILPLDNLSRDPEQEYFADGMTEALIAELAQVRELRVISRASVMAYKTTEKPLAQIARELGVDAVVEGSIQRIGGRVRVTTEIVNAATGRRQGAKIHERDLKDALSLQSEVAHALVADGGVPVSIDERGRLARTRTLDPEAIEAYLSGRFYLHRGTEAEIGTAIDLFERVLSRDASYAPAWAALAESYISLSRADGPLSSVMPQAKLAAERAIALDDGLAEAHGSLGRVRLQWEWDWIGAEEALKRALDLRPGASDARAAYSVLLTATGRPDEAVVQIWLAQQQDPLSLPVNLSAGWINFQARRFDQAIVDFGTAIAIEPGSGLAHAGLAASLAQRSRFAEALREAEKAVDANQGPMVLATVGGVYAADGQASMARRLQALAVKQVACPLEIAAIHVALNERNEAFRWLDRGFRERSACMSFVRTDARLDPLRADRRYADLVRRMNLR
ncbi:MAG: hypothetical protein A3H95_08795 [Acidobacteria bacterium RIFCSPLOWO2_02_FULL_64_15]|nr:MAG: hypothetical protein A3H95_08795 [Acidobacteria bacterium RIFCSPLOWO2_02_FULL_64_15]